MGVASFKYNKFRTFNLLLTKTAKTYRFANLLALGEISKNKQNIRKVSNFLNVYTGMKTLPMLSLFHPVAKLINVSWLLSSKEGHLYQNEFNTHV